MCEVANFTHKYIYAYVYNNEDNNYIANKVNYSSIKGYFMRVWGEVVFTK